MSNWLLTINNEFDVFHKFEKLINYKKNSRLKTKNLEYQSNKNWLYWSTYTQF